MKRLTSLFALYLLLNPAAANAEKWWVAIQKDPEGITWMGDSDSIVGHIDAYTVYKGERLPRDPGARTVWFHKYFPTTSADGMKSAKLQWRIDCEKKTWRQLGFIDYDASYNVIDEDAIMEETKPVKVGFVSAELYAFACNTAEYRKANFLEIGSGVDYRQTAEFFNDPRQITEVNPNKSPSPSARRQSLNSSTLQSKGNTAATATERLKASRQYRDCVVASAEKFASSKETAPVVAQSAVQNCATSRAKIRKISLAEMGYNSTRIYLEVLDKHVLSEAQLSVVKRRSLRRK